MKETFPIEQVAKLFAFCIALIFSQTVLGQTQCKFKITGSITPQVLVVDGTSGPGVSASGSFQALEGCVPPISTLVYPKFFERGGDFSTTFPMGSFSDPIDPTWFAKQNAISVTAVDACGAAASRNFYYCVVYFPGCEVAFNDAVSKGDQIATQSDPKGYCCYLADARPSGPVSEILDTKPSDPGRVYKLEDVIDVAFSFEDNYRKNRLARDSVEVKLPFSPFDNIQVAVTVNKLCPSKPAPERIQFGGQLVGTDSNGVEHVFDTGLAGAGGLVLDPKTADSNTPRYVGMMNGEVYSLAQSKERLDELLDLIGQQGGITFRLLELIRFSTKYGAPPFRSKDFGQLPLSACHQISGSYPERDMQGKIVPLVSLRTKGLKARIPAMELYNLSWGQRYDTGGVGQLFPYSKYTKQLPVFVDFYPIGEFEVEYERYAKEIKSSCASKFQGSPIYTLYPRRTSPWYASPGYAGRATRRIVVYATPNGNLRGPIRGPIYVPPEHNTFSHELGHVLGNLLDEYRDPSGQNDWPESEIEALSTNLSLKPFVEAPVGYVRSKRLYAHRAEQLRPQVYIPSRTEDSLMGTGGNIFNIPSCASIMSKMEGRPAPEFLETCANNGALRPDCVATGCPDNFICDQETRYCMAMDVAKKKKK